MRTTIAELVRTYRQNGLRLRVADETHVLSNLDEPIRIETELLGKLKGISTDPRLTAAGRADAAREAGRIARDALKRWYSVRRDGLDKFEASLRAEIVSVARPPAADPNDVAGRIENALLRAEIRRAAGTLEPLQLENLYRLGSPTVRAALEELPQIVVNGAAVTVRPHISDEVRQSSIEQVAVGQKPDLGDRLHDFREMSSIYNTVNATIDGTIADRTPGPGEQPVGVR